MSEEAPERIYTDGEPIAGGDLIATTAKNRQPEDTVEYIRSDRALTLEQVTEYLDTVETMAHRSGEKKQVKLVSAIRADLLAHFKQGET